MTDTVVVQPWTQYPPALANVRVLNHSTLEMDGVKTEQTTVMLLEPLWVWGQKIYSEDEVILLDKSSKVSIGSGTSVRIRLDKNPNRVYEKYVPRKDYVNPWQRTPISPADAKKWNKELLRSMVMDEKEYDQFLNPFIIGLTDEVLDAVSDAGSSSNWEDMSASMIEDDAKDEAEEFIRMLTLNQLIRLNHYYMGYTVNDYKDAPDKEAVLQVQMNNLLETIFAELYVSDDDIYSARVSYLEGLEDSRYDNWEPDY